MTRVLYRHPNRSFMVGWRPGQWLIGFHYDFPMDAYEILILGLSIVLPRERWRW